MIYNHYTDYNYSPLLLTSPQRTYLASRECSLGISAKFKPRTKLTKIQKQQPLHQRSLAKNIDLDYLVGAPGLEPGTR